MNRGLLLRLAAGGVWLVAACAAFGVFEYGPAQIGDQEIVVILAGLAVIFALDVWGWVKRGGG